MQAVAEGLWALADEQERRGDLARAAKCLEAICQSEVTFLPIVEVKTRLRLAHLLLHHTHNLSHARVHLERAHLLLSSIPSSFELKFRVHSLLSQCYHLVGSIHRQRLLLHRALDLVRSASSRHAHPSASLWACNFHSHLASACVVDGDYPSAMSALDDGLALASDVLQRPDLQMYFTSVKLHVHLLQWEDAGVVAKAVEACNEAWESMDEDQRQQCIGLFFYNELLHVFYLLRICDHKTAAQHVDKLDAAMKNDLQKIQQIDDLSAELDTVNRALAQSDLPCKERASLDQKHTELQEQLVSILQSSSANKDPVDHAVIANAARAWKEKLHLAPPPFDGEWLPRRAVYALVDLMAVMLARPKGWFKDCGKRIQSGLDVLHEELGKLGINTVVTEVDLRHSTIWIAGLYLTILMQFLENKVAVELTRTEFSEAQEALRQMIDWFIRFPTILQGCESIIELLRGQYAHSLGCFSEAIFHFTEASKLTESKSTQTMFQVYSAVSYICLGDAESSSQALDLIGPIYRIMDTFAGVREKTCIIFVYGLLLMKQHNLQESRIRLASGLKIAHQHLGNIQLVSQFLTVLGTLALEVHDTAQAKEILKSSLTLAKTLYDIPTQVWVLSVLTDLYKGVNEKNNEMENAEYERKKEDDLQKRLSEAQSSSHHLELIEKVRIKVQKLQGNDSKSAGGPSARTDLDIPESVGLLKSSTAAPITRLRDPESAKKGKKKC